MVDTFRTKIARSLAPSVFKRAEERERAPVRDEAAIMREVNRRVAETLSKMDPFEPLFKEFGGIFSEEYEHPEENLDDKGQLMLTTWAWQNRDHPAFKHLLAWIMNTQGNETLKRANPTPERIMYGRAQISGMILFRKEVRRLAQLYDDMLAKKKGDDFDPQKAVE